MWTYWVVWHVWAFMVVVFIRCTVYFILVYLSSCRVSRNYAFYITCMVLDIALCWCWQRLLTVGGHLLPHIVTPFNVNTVAWRCRQTQDVLQPAECPQGTLQNARKEHCNHQSDSEEQVSSLPDIALEVVAACLLQIRTFSGISQLVMAVGQV